MFEGVLTALVTPMRDGALDERAFEELVERQVGGGVDAIVPCGTTGESATLSHAEHRRVIELAVAAARGRIQVIAGTGSNSTREAIELTLHAREAGADGALLISPYYNKPTQRGITAHFSEIARRTSFPLIVYNIPSRTSSNIEASTMARLAEIDQIVAVKEATGDIGQVSRLIALAPPDFSVLAGDDLLTLPLMSIGGRGVISTLSNVAPGDMVEVVRAYREGDTERAREAHLRLVPLVDALFCETNPIPVKAALAMMGLIREELRLPLTPLADSYRASLQGALKELGLL
jgi:4-hydroxy-tetrahydrodipicolinate synthase